MTTFSPSLPSAHHARGSYLFVKGKDSEERPAQIIESDPQIKMFRLRYLDTNENKGPFRYRWDETRGEAPLLFRPASPEEMKKCFPELA